MTTFAGLEPITSATGWLDTEVTADPAGCRTAAAELRHLADALALAAHVLAREADLPATDLGGVAGRAFRDHAGRLAREGRRTGSSVAALAADLDELAARLSDCRASMASIRARARAHLLLTPTTIQAPSLGRALPATQDAWQLAVAAVDAVRRREAAAQSAWREALSRAAPGTTPDSEPVVGAAATALDHGPAGQFGVTAGHLAPPPGAPPFPAPASTPTSPWPPDEDPVTVHPGSGPQLWPATPPHTDPGTHAGGSVLVGDVACIDLVPVWPATDVVSGPHPPTWTHD